MVKTQDLGRSLERKKKSRLNSVGQKFVANSILEESQIDDYVNFCGVTDSIILVHGRANNSLNIPSMDTLPAPTFAISNENFIVLPRKPSWQGWEGEAEEYQRLEEREFYRWRAQLANLENSNSHLIMTPFERNLGIWRELWRAVEKADVLIQVLDARNPMFFFCEDLFKYSKEVNPETKNYIILNKSDLLTAKQRQSWSAYFQERRIDCFFFSNFQEGKEQDTVCPILSPEGLVSSIKALMKSSKDTVSFVGYPNVGKSSTINSLLGISRAAVSATPGKTKHIQTFETEDFVICDCPGLVFPNMAASKSHLILDGVMSIDQMREYLPPVILLVERVPLAAIEACYNIKVTFEHNVSLAESVLSAYARSRGLATSNFGNPDMAKASRIILKDYTGGKLCFCFPPPGMSPKEFNMENPFSKCQEPDFSVVHEPEMETNATHGFKVLDNRTAPKVYSKKHNKMNKRR